MSTFARAAAGLALAALCVAVPASAQTRLSPQQVNQRVEELLGRLTLEQKIDLIGGLNNMFVRAEPGIGLPALKMSDGPVGVRTWGKTTGYAGGIGLAASWDTALAHRVGVALGNDARARGVNFLLGPGMDIYRLPVNGRNFEYFGEDPYLAGQIAAGYIRGVQSQGVAATAKHFALNNSEYDRHNENSIVDERTLHEIYLPAFEAAVREGHVAAVMDSYNLVDGVHASQNPLLDTQILKHDWGFQGILMSDWGGTYDGVAAANSGQDLEMPSARFMNRATLLPAIAAGAVTRATIDDKVRRILRVAVEFGWLDRPQTDPNIPLYDQASRAAALQSAEESMVLLKNDGHLLPFNLAQVHSIAVIGPNAYPAVPSAGGSAQIDDFAAVSDLVGLGNLAGGKVRVLWNRGLKSLDEIFNAGGYVSGSFTTDAAGHHRGLRVEQFDNPDFQGAPVQAGTVQHLDSATGNQWAPGVAHKISLRYSGYYTPKSGGPQRFLVASVGGDAYALYVNGKLELRQGVREGQVPMAAELELPAGQPAAIRLDYQPQTDHPRLGFGALPAAEMVEPGAIAMASHADAVVLAVGFNPQSEGEAHDRTYRLPAGQVELINAVLAANPRTVVAITSGGSVATERWIARAPAVIETWYGGQEGGRALAEALLGQVNPSGHLPISWERKLENDPAYGNYYEAPGTHDVTYSEGLMLGYRYFDHSAVKPLFPFGYGLSYTTFAFRNLSVTPSSGSPDGPFTVAFDIVNAGSRAGAAVGQVYVGDPSARLPRPEKELKGFARVFLNPGQSRRVSVTLRRRSLAYWSPSTHGWQVDPGRFVVYVGDSAAHVPLHAAFTVR